MLVSRQMTDGTCLEYDLSSNKRQYDGSKHFSLNVWFIADSSILTAGTQIVWCAPE